MMEHTDRHYRYFMRLLTRQTILYTEMITTGAIIHGDRDRFLSFSPEEKPLVLQLGGNDPNQLAMSAAIGEAYGYDEINLNVGCPSDRVQGGGFGAQLMTTPRLTADCVREMQTAVSIPVTVKHRLGVDDQDSYEEVKNFVELLADAGCRRFIVHARKAILGGLSPKDNRSVPPLRYENVYRLKEDFSELLIELNGGVTTLPDAASHLPQVDGVMLGRAAYDTPYIFSMADGQFFNAAEVPPPSRREVLTAMLPYVEEQVKRGVPYRVLTHAFFHLFAGKPGARKFRQIISEGGRRKVPFADIIREATSGIPEDVLDQRGEERLHDPNAGH